MYRPYSSAMHSLLLSFFLPSTVHGMVADGSVGSGCYQRNWFSCCLTSEWNLLLEIVHYLCLDWSFRCDFGVHFLIRVLTVFHCLEMTQSGRKDVNPVTKASCLQPMHPDICNTRTHSQIFHMMFYTIEVYRQDKVVWQNTGRPCFSQAATIRQSSHIKWQLIP